MIISRPQKRYLVALAEKRPCIISADEHTLLESYGLIFRDDRGSHLTPRGRDIVEHLQRTREDWEK